MLLGLLGGAQLAHAQGPIVDGGTYKLIHYGVVADGSAATYGVPAGTPLCLDVDSGKPDVGVIIGQWGDIDNLTAQRFVLEKQTDGAYKIHHAGTPVYLQPVGGAIAAGTQIEQNVASNSDYQHWFITDPNSNGRYKFTLKNSANAAGVSQVLEVGFASPAPGAKVNLFDDNGFEPAQRWQLVLTASPLATKSAAAIALKTEAYPSPLSAGQRLSVRVEALRSGPANVEVLDMLGQRVHSQAAALQAGTNAVLLAPLPLAAGIYVVRVHQGDLMQQTRIVQQ